MFYIQEKVAENLISTWNWKVFLIIDAIISTLLIAISSNFRQPIYMINGNVLLSLQKILCDVNIMNRSFERWKSNYNSCTKVFGWLSNFSGQNPRILIAINGTILALMRANDLTGLVKLNSIWYGFKSIWIVHLLKDKSASILWCKKITMEESCKSNYRIMPRMNFFFRKIIFDFFKNLIFI